MPNDTPTLRFLRVAQTVRLHELSIARFGSTMGLRERGLLESAAAMPEQTFNGVLLHANIGEMAAAYLFPLSQNHAFLDGNKRIGLLACEAFLNLNAFELALSSEAVEEIVMQIACGYLSKEGLAERLNNRLDWIWNSV